MPSAAPALFSHFFENQLVFCTCDMVKYRLVGNPVPGMIPIFITFDKEKRHE